MFDSNMSGLLSHPIMWVTVVSVIGMHGAYIYAMRHRRVDIVDVVWAYGMTLAPIVYAIAGTGDGWVRFVTVFIASGWYGRLAWHLHRRFVHSHEEDSRYQAMRGAMGRHQAWGFYAFFMLQAGFIVFFTMPMYALANASMVAIWVSVGAILIALVAWLGVKVADQQLWRFKQTAPRSAVMREGLWACSRHPNYFFEWLHWWSYVLLGLSAGVYWIIIYLIVMYVFLRYLTGVPFSEQQAIAKRGAAYRQYQAVTPVFFPNFKLYRPVRPVSN